MMMKKIVFLLAMSSAFCKAQNDTTFNWLLGKWEGNTTHGKFFEKWKKGKKGLDGSGGEIVRGDTIFKETLILMKRKSKWIYIAEVTSADKKQAPIEFPLVQMPNHRYKFENKKHDFPQAIIYEYYNSDHFKARVEGSINGKPSQNMFDMQRVK
jgi:hypothetical protein